MSNKLSSKRPLILCADHFYLGSEALARLNEVGEVVWSKTGREDDLANEVGEASVIASEYCLISSRIFDRAPKLKAVSVWGVGYDHVDVEAATSRGIYVTNCRGANAESVAEHTFSMLLALSRKTLALDNFVRQGRWNTQQEIGVEKQMTPRDLFGKTIGVIGFGEIGSRVARISRGFEMRIIAYDPYVSHERLGEFGATSVDLEELLRVSDFVTIHSVLSPETRGMIGETQIRLMKPTAILVNVSRGAVVDQVALSKALRERRIAAAGLDVFSKEPLDPKDPLMGQDNIVLSPHIAGGSQEALDRTSLVLAEEISRVLRAEVPKNLVNRLELRKMGFL